jgi:hypothetical protein
MKSFTLRISLAASLLFLLSLVGALPTRSDSARAQLNPTEDRGRQRRSRPGLKPLSYRSPGSTHKLVLPADDPELEQQLMSMGVVRKFKKYQAYSVAEVGDAELGSLDAATLERANLRDDLNLVLLKRGQLDTTGPAPTISTELRQPETAGRALHLVQLFGPPTTDSVKAITATGAKIVGYIPNNTYLIWTTRAQRQQLHAMRQSANGASVIQWDGPYHPAYKLDPRINIESVEQISISVEILDSAEADNSIEMVESIANKVLVREFRAAGAIHIKILAEANKLKEIAKAADVLAIERWSPMKLMDERADQIVAGALSFETVNNIQVSHPKEPGYLAFLNSLGFNSNFDFTVDVGDTGFDVGSADSAKIHPDFLDASGASRVSYLHDFTGDFHADHPTESATHDSLGHGTINASIVGGFNNKSGSAYTDALGFDYGLGIAPFARIGVSKIITDDGSLSENVSYPDFIAAAYREGARITNNSWGDDSGSNVYAVDCQAFDALVRDADPLAPGNQSMVVVFAAGNNGDGATPSISFPGTAKNVITVGASENFRTEDTDGCGEGSSGADNGQDILRFSANGPVQDGRAKPDLVAPGSHIVGAASQDTLFDGGGVCGSPGTGPSSRYFPAGQTLYTWSTGTSHSAPIVSGAAALAFQWLKTTLGQEPSAALVKAFMLNSTSYLNGAFGGDSLPGAHQGWGLLDIGRTFETTNRILYDESPSRTFTESGGAPFETTGVITDSSKEFRVMLVWTDPPGDPGTNAPYVNQLNLEVVVDGVVYSGNHFSGQYSTTGGQKDFLNNAQGVRLPAGTTGPFVIRVRPTVIAGDGVPGNDSPLDQDFALVVTNGQESAIPVLTVDSAGDVSAGVTVQHSNGTTDSSVIAGESAKIVVTVKNQSQIAGASIQAASLALAASQTASTFADIAAGQTGTNASPFQIQIPSNLRCGSVTTLQLQLDTNAGRFTLPVRVQVGRPTTAGGPPETLMFDDVDHSTVKWKMKGGFGPVSGTATSGTMSFHTQDSGDQQNKDSQLSQLFTKKGFLIPANAGQVRLSFFHIFNFEPGYDGGVLEISVDGGDYQDAGSLMLLGGYDGKVTEASNNPLGSRFAWTARGRPGVFTQVVVDLSDFAGTRVRLRFLAGFDDATGIADGYTGWFIDDIRVTAVMYTCGQAQSSQQEIMTEGDGRGPRKVTRTRRITD